MYRADRTSKNKMFSDRLMWFHIMFVVLVGLFILYLFCIQVVDIKEYRVKAKKQRRASAFVMRGNIFDRNGIKLATDTV